jgi:hypothetical protein
MPEARGGLEEAVFIVILIDYLAAGTSMTARDQNTDDFLLSPPDWNSKSWRNTWAASVKSRPRFLSGPGVSSISNAINGKILLSLLPRECKFWAGSASIEPQSAVVSGLGSFEAQVDFDSFVLNRTWEFWFGLVVNVGDLRPGAGETGGDVAAGQRLRRVDISIEELCNQSLLASGPTLSNSSR